MSKVKIMVLNAQDLFLFMDKHKGEHLQELNEIKWQLMSSSLFSNKSKEKCQMLAQTIAEIDPDIIMMTEVGGLESLNNFSRFLLNDHYQAFSLPSNSDRGIDMGYLIHKRQAWQIKLKSYADYPLPKPALKFSRDILELDVSIAGNLKFILLLTHIKSKLDLKKNDFEGRSRRIHEIQALVKIYLDLQENDIPVLIGGDFNGLASEISTEEEFLPIYKETDLKDIAHLAKIPLEERFSYIYFTRGGQRFQQQIDYLFISEKYANLIESSECFFPRYKNIQGSPLPIPKRIEQKSLLPSDHYPFVASIEL